MLRFFYLKGRIWKVPRSKIALKKFKGDLIGSDDSNPLLNSIVCDVEFLDVAVKLYVAYVIAKNMYSPVHSIDTITCSWFILCGSSLYLKPFTFFAKCTSFSTLNMYQKST